MRTKWERINRTHGKRKSNYPSFDKALDLHFGYDLPNDKEDLKRRMKDYGFLVRNDVKEDVTDLQSQHAWNYLVKKYFPYQKEITDYYGTETYSVNRKTKKPNYVYRASRNIEYKGKKYRRGQFMPNQSMLEGVEDND